MTAGAHDVGALSAHFERTIASDQYSICSPAGALPRVGARRVDTGLFSEWLVDRLAPGDEIEVLGRVVETTVRAGAAAEPRGS